MPESRTAARPYGPNTPLVRTFLERLAALPPLAWLAAARRYADTATTPAGRTADRALGAAIRHSAREQARDALVGPILQIAARAASSAAMDVNDREQVERLAEPALAAALALVVVDVLADEQFGLLSSAFGSIVPRPGATDPAGPRPSEPEPEAGPGPGPGATSDGGAGSPG